MLASAIIFGTTGTAQALGPDSATPLGIGAMRILVGAAGLIGLALLTGARRIEWRTNRAAIIVAGLGVAGYQIGFFQGTERAGVALGTLVALGSGPVFAGLFDALRYRRWPSSRWLGATLLAGGGAALVAFARDDTAGSSVVTGVIAALVAGLSYAVFSIASKQVMARGADSTSVMAAVFTAGAVLLAPLLWIEPMGWLSSGRGVAVALHLGLIATTAAYSLFGYGLDRLSVPTVVTLTLAEPATAAVLSVVVLSEELAPIGWLGVGLVMAGVAIIATGGSDPMAE